MQELKKNVYVVKDLIFFFDQFFGKKQQKYRDVNSLKRDELLVQQRILILNVTAKKIKINQGED